MMMTITRNRRVFTVFDEDDLVDFLGRFLHGPDLQAFLVWFAVSPWGRRLS
jgi:hypothetical protein